MNDFNDDEVIYYDSGYETENDFILKDESSSISDDEVNYMNKLIDELDSDTDSEKSYVEVNSFYNNNYCDFITLDNAVEHYNNRLKIKFYLYDMIKDYHIFDFDKIIQIPKKYNKNYKRKYIKKLNRLYEKEIKKFNNIDIYYYNIYYNEINILNNIDYNYNYINYNKILNVKNKLKGILFISYFINRYINYRKCENYDICNNIIVPGEDHCQSCIDEQQTVDSNDYIIDEKLRKKYIQILEDKKKNIIYKGYILKYKSKGIYETEFNGMVYTMDIKFLKDKINNYISKIE